MYRCVGVLEYRRLLRRKVVDVWAARETEVGECLCVSLGDLRREIYVFTWRIMAASKWRRCKIFPTRSESLRKVMSVYV